MDYKLSQLKVTKEKLKRYAQNGKDEKNIKRLKNAIDLLSPFVDKSLPFLDIGGRDDWFLSYLTKIGFSNLTSIDISPLSVKLLRRKGFKAYEADIYDMSIFEDNKFNTITAIHIIEHCPEPEIAINEIFRILAKNGITYLEVPIEKIPSIKSAHFTCFKNGSEFLQLLDRFEILHTNQDPLRPHGNFSCIIKKD